LTVEPELLRLELRRAYTLFRHEPVNPTLQIALWIAHPVLEVSLAVLMIRRKLNRIFPTFFIYIISQILNFAVLFPLYLHQNGSAAYARFFYAYWISSAISISIGFKVIHEIFLDVFRPYHTLKDLGTVLYKWAALVMLLVALVVAAASPGSQSPLTQAVIIVQRCVRVIQCGLILFLLVFSRYLGVSWRQHSFGIALGFGGFASVELTAVALYSGGQIHPDTLSLLNTAAYGFSILTWLGYALLKKEARQLSGTMLMSQRWEQSLTDLRTPHPDDSLIPMFEGMVDRAFSRTPSEEEATRILSEELTPQLSSSPKKVQLPLPSRAPVKT